MFVDESTMGESYRPKKYYRFPLRIILAVVVLPTVVNLSVMIGIAFDMLGQAERANLCYGVGAFVGAVWIWILMTTAVRVRNERLQRWGPPW